MDIHAFTAVSPIFNREIITDVLFAVTTQQKDISKFKKVRALWDTGATNSVITPHVINDLKNKGVTTIERKGTSRLELLDEINEGTVVFSAHGVSPLVYEKAKEKLRKGLL